VREGAGVEVADGMKTGTPTVMKFKERCSLLAVLANASGHFLSLELPDGYVVERWQVSKLLRVLKELEDLPEHELLFRLDEGRVTKQVASGWSRSSYVYVVVTSVFIEAGDIFHAHQITSEMSSRLDQNFLLMRLFVHGEARVFSSYWYLPRKGDNCGELLGSTTFNETFENDPTRLTSWSVQRINEVFRVVKFPFKYEYLNLALEFMEGASRYAPLHMRFLSLMIGMEVMFNLGPQDIRYRVARSAAVLLGDDEMRAVEVFDQVKKLYDLRSKIVHVGAKDKVSRDDYWWAKYLLRRSIVSAYQSGLDKQALMDKLGRTGFGHWNCREWHYIYKN
jgi:hypothetical protein